MYNSHFRRKRINDMKKKATEKKEQEQYGQKVGRFDQYGQEIKNIKQAKERTGELYATQDEALDRRYSKGSEKPESRRPSLFGNARANIFGN